MIEESKNEDPSVRDSVFVKIDNIIERMKLDYDVPEIIDGRLVTPNIREHKTYAIKLKVMHNDDRMHFTIPIWFEFDPEDTKGNNGFGMFFFQRPKDGDRAR